ncbi:MAG TPA: cysteine peptidase family C39 domain-containing protein, partial [Actinomycetota bacterium]|nr:cysteine peptidase family C39 domain-containing protein [Actinomycetota bacterium]
MTSRVRVMVPGRPQIEGADSSAACLGMVLEYFGRYASPEELRDRCGISRDGAAFADLVAAAESYGLEPTTFRRTAAEVKGVGLPAILTWRHGHYVV